MLDWYPSYFPRIKVHGRIQPLFPAYVFVLIGDKPFYPVRWCPHVIRLLMSGDHPAWVSDSIINEIQRREDENGLVQLPKPAQRFHKGQQVRVVRGALEGQIGLYENMSGKDRERVLLELLGQTVPVDLPGKDIAPLNVVGNQSRIRY